MSDWINGRSGSCMLLCVELEGADFPAALLKQLPVRRLWLRALDAQSEPAAWAQLDRRLGELLGPAATLGRRHAPLPSIASHERRSPKTTAPALRLIAERHTEKLTVRQLATSCSMTAVTFARRFKQETGMTVASFLCAYRLACARELLNRTDMAIKEVAVRAGFEDNAYFCRVFKRSQGMTPRAYRELCRIETPS